jgi:hypothetical protein
MKKITFLLTCLLITVISTAQVTIIEITEAQATLLLDSLKKKGIGHTHTKQWTDGFVNLESARNTYIGAIVKIHKFIMPDQLDINEKHNTIMEEYIKIVGEVRVLEDSINSNNSANLSRELDQKKQRIKVIEEVEFIKHPYVHSSHFSRSIEESYNGSGVELGDTLYVYSSGLPSADEYLEFDINKTKYYTFINDGTREYSLNTVYVNFGIICNRSIEGKMYANR